MPVGQIHDALSFRFVVDYDEPEVLAPVEALLRDLRPSQVNDTCETHGAPGVVAFRAFEHSTRVRNAALVALMGRINREALRSTAGSLLLHAGGVSRHDGRTAVLCGPSGSGKSTLTAGLVSRGYAYVTDETVCMRPRDLAITPFRKPIQLKAGSQHLFSHLVPVPGSAEAGLFDAQLLVAASAFGGTPLPEGPLLPEILIFPTHASGERLRVEPISQAEAAFLVGRNSSLIYAMDGGTMPALTRLARRVPAFRLLHDDHEAALDAVERLWEAAA